MGASGSGTAGGAGTARGPAPERPRGGTLCCRALAAAASAALLGLALRRAALAVVERSAFVTPPAGGAQPDDFGTPSLRLAFPSGGRTLHACHVAVPGDPAAPALFVCHGDDEELSRWAEVQHVLREDGIASFVFDYSGYGASGGRPTVARLRQDTLAAHARFVALTPRASRRVALGFSLGSAVLLDAAARLRPAPDAIAIGAGFASAREMAVLAGRVPRGLARLLPDAWNGAARIARLGAMPLLLLHARDDEVVPLSQARRLHAAAGRRARLVVLEGIGHDAPLSPREAAGFWGEVVGFVKAAAPPALTPPRPSP